MIEYRRTEGDGRARRESIGGPGSPDPHDCRNAAESNRQWRSTAARPRERTPCAGGFAAETEVLTEGTRPTRGVGNLRPPVCARSTRPRHQPNVDHRGSDRAARLIARRTPYEATSDRARDASTIACRLRPRLRRVLRAVARTSASASNAGCTSVVSEPSGERTVTDRRTTDEAYCRISPRTVAGRGIPAGWHGQRSARSTGARVSSPRENGSRTVNHPVSNRGTPLRVRWADVTRRL